MRIDYYKYDEEWMGAHHLDELPADVDKFAASMLGDFDADWYVVRLVDM